jgi:hypothetical protein
MASLKAKVAVGALILQNNKSKFSSSPVSPICQICHTEPEDVIEKEFSYAIESVCSIDLVRLSLFYGILPSSRSGN